MGTEPVLVDVTFRSHSGRSLTHRPPGSEDELALYAASEETRSGAVKALRELGFALVGPASPFGVTISGTPALIQEVFGGGTPVVPPTLAAWIESVRLPPPGEYYARSKF